MAPLVADAAGSFSPTRYFPQFTRRHEPWSVNDWSATVGLISRKRAVRNPEWNPSSNVLRNYQWPLPKSTG